MDAWVHTFSVSGRGRSALDGVVLKNFDPSEPTRNVPPGRGRRFESFDVSTIRASGVGRRQLGFEVSLVAATVAGCEPQARVRAFSGVFRIEHLARVAIAVAATWSSEKEAVDRHRASRRTGDSVSHEKRNSSKKEIFLQPRAEDLILANNFNSLWRDRADDVDRILSLPRSFP
jgi:hypothetical protein